MLFKHKLGAYAPAEYQPLQQLEKLEIRKTTLSLLHTQYSAEELSELCHIHQVQPVAIELPESLFLSLDHFHLEAHKEILEQLSLAFPEFKPFIILKIKPVSVAEIFDYLEANPGDFKALLDYKELWMEKLVDQIVQLKEIAAVHKLQLLLENTPMGADFYFEPGQERIYPLLRTPQQLKEICAKTGIGVCFHTGNARVTTNVFRYMRRSRSIFAAATEEEIIQSPQDWLEYYDQLEQHVQLIHLCDSISWGDTPHSNNIAFRAERVHELLDLAERLENKSSPVILHVPAIEQDQQVVLKDMLQQLKALK